MMPCNVVVYEGDDGRAVVMAVDPMQTIAADDEAPAQLRELAAEVQQRLARALEWLR